VIVLIHRIIKKEKSQGIFAESNPLSPKGKDSTQRSVEEAIGFISWGEVPPIKKTLPFCVKGRKGGPDERELGVDRWCRTGEKGDRWSKGKSN